MNFYKVKVCGQKGIYPVGHTETQYSFHGKMFSMLCFVCLLFLFVVLRGQILGDRELRGVEVHDVKVTKNQLKS